MTTDGPQTPSWSPDDAVERLIELRLTALREGFATDLAAKREELAGDAARRGTLLSGGFLRQVAQIAADELHKYGQAVASALVESVLLANNGRVPAGAGAWLEKRFEESVERLPESLARSLASGPNAIRSPGVQSSLHAILVPAAQAGRRQFEIKIAEAEVRNRLTGIAAGAGLAAGTSTASVVAANRDLFVSYAGEDRDVAEAIVKGLQARGVSVWFAGHDLKVGDRLLDKIDQALAMSRHGVVLISPAFLAKNWPRRELAALAALEGARMSQMILPVWHGVDQKAVAAQSPVLAAVLGTNTHKGIDVVVEDLVRAITV